MNKKLIFILTISLTIFLMISTVSAGNIYNFLSNDDSNITNTEDKFIMGFNSEFPPFGYTDNDKIYAGFDIDLAKEVCKRNNWTFVPVPVIDWNSKKMELDSNEIDCIWSEFTINGRENDYTWSKPYFNNSKLIIVKSNSNYTTLDDLKGKSLEIQQGSSLLDTINNNQSLKSTFKEITEVDTYNTAMMDLDAGLCDVVIVDSALAHYLVEKYPNTKLLNEPINYEQYGIGFKKGNTELRDQVQKTLDEMFKDGTVDKIAQNYSKYDIPKNVIQPQ